MTVRQAALAYHAAGINVLPIKLDGSKAPFDKTLPMLPDADKGGKLTAQWRQWCTRAQTVEEVDELFPEGVDCGIAVLGGIGSRGLEIIDFDRPGSFEPWRDMVEHLSPGLIDELPVIKTPCGHHVYFRSEVNGASQPKLAKAAEKYSKPGDKSDKPSHDVIIESKGAGGYVVAPPTPARAHLAGIAYVHASGPQIGETPTINQETRNLLFTCAVSFNEKLDKGREDKALTPSKPSNGKMVLRKLPGEDFNARASWDEVLKPLGWTVAYTVGDKTCWWYPGKTSGSLSATTGFLRTGGLYVFSSSTSLEPGRSYSKFSVYGQLEHGGDFTAAAKTLRAKGYGDQKTPPRHEQPAPSKADAWAKLQGKTIAAQHEPSPPTPTDEDAPTQSEHDETPHDQERPITVSEIGFLVDEDSGGFLEEPNFSRILALKADDVAWFRALAELSRKKGCKTAFMDKVKRHETEAKRKAPEHEGWRNNLLWRETKDGPILDKCVTNLIEILTHDVCWRGVLALDTFSQQFVCRKPPPFTRELTARWVDADGIRTKSWIERNYAIRPSTNDVNDAIVAVCAMQAFSSQVEYLDTLEDQGRNVLDTWLTDYLGVEDTPLTRAIGAKWMIAAVARAYDPGCKADNVLILEGEQGMKKSRILSQLCPKPSWFADGLSDFGTKAQAEEIEGKWIVELGELTGFARADIDKIKSFVTRASENYRPAYARYKIDSPRHCVFAGTVNPGATGYLRDETGNRRFWPVKCTKQAPELTPMMRDQLWAEARSRYLAKENWWLEDEVLLSDAKREQAERMSIDPWQETIEYLLIGLPEVSNEAIFDHLKIEMGKRDQKELNRVGRVMRGLNPKYEAPPNPPTPDREWEQGAMRFG